MAAFDIPVTRQSSIAVVVAMRSEWPFMQPSPKNWPGPTMPTTASFPCSDMTTTLTRPTTGAIAATPAFCPQRLQFEADFAHPLRH